MLLEAGGRRRHQQRAELAVIVAHAFNSPDKLADLLRDHGPRADVGHDSPVDFEREEWWPT
jgi:hypothetical protein